MPGTGASDAAPTPPIPTAPGWDTHPRNMSAIEPSEQSQSTHLEELPQFDLEYLFDDDDSPTEVTVFADDPEALSTQWITVDRNCAVPLEEVR